MSAPSPERTAAFVRAVIEETAVMVAITLAIGCLGVWALIIADKMQ